MPVLKVGIKLVRNDSWKNDLAQVFDNELILSIFGLNLNHHL